MKVWRRINFMFKQQKSKLNSKIVLFLALLLAVVLVLGACTGTGSGTNDGGSNDVTATETPMGGAGDTCDTGGTGGDTMTPAPTAETQ
jgi:hypothetical protein